MELTFYDSNGRSIAYIEDGMYIYLFSGKPVAYLSNESVYLFSGKHIGRLMNGWIRDNNGQCVLFSEDATGGPMKPMKMMKTMRSMKQMKPMKSMKQMRPMRPMGSLSWSKLSGAQFCET